MLYVVFWGTSFASRLLTTMIQPTLIQRRVRQAQARKDPSTWVVLSPSSDGFGSPSTSDGALERVNPSGRIIVYDSFWRV